MDSEYLLIVYLLVAARLLVPLSIPRYPLFGILACMILDAADQSIMQSFGVVFLRYQGYDKALDIYYLSIAYLSTMRNWENLEAFQISRVLYYLRLIGTLAFELTGARVFLFVFPNAFEPFFVYYEIVRRRGNPLLLTRGAIIAIVAVIWFVLKLPHEWWIHVAKLDATDFIKTRVLGGSPDVSFWRAIIEAPVVTGSLTVVAALLVLASWRVHRGRRRRAAEAGTLGQAPTGWAAHWRRRAAAARPGDSLQRARRRLRAAILRGHTASSVRPEILIEKIVLVAMVSVIFQQVLPGLKANGIQTALFIALAIVATDFLLRWALRRFGVPSSPGVDLAMTGALNFLFVLLFQLVVPVIPPRYNLPSAFLFAALITLFVTLYDHFRPAYDARAFLAQGKADDSGVPG